MSSLVLAPESLAPPPRLRPTVVASPFTEVGAVGERFVVAADGHTFVMGPALHRLVCALQDHPASIEALAARYNEGNPRPLLPAQLQAIIEERVPKALLQGSDVPPPRRPFVVSYPVLSPRVVAAVVQRLAWAFSPVVAAVVLLAFGLAVAWVLPAALSGAQALDAVGVLVLLVLVVASLVAHELGHATACARFGCAPGEIGAGIYFYFPVLYSDVTDAWRLRPAHRAVVDLGGIYFQAVAAAAVVAVAPHHPVTHAFLLVTVVSMLHMLNPAFKMDGYWLLSDLSGLTNLHGQAGRALGAALRAPFSRGNAATSPPAGARPQGVKAGTLYLYAAYLTAYVVVAVRFVALSVAVMVETYPPQAAAHLGAAAAAFYEGDPSALGLEVWGLAAASLWPALLVAAVGYVLVRLARLFF